MRSKTFLKFVLIGLISFVFIACSSKEEKTENAAKTEQPKKAPETVEQPQMPAIAPAHTPVVPTATEQSSGTSASTAKGSVAGIEWEVPEHWKTQDPRAMRVVTYSIPPTGGDTEGGECGVFFFGSGQGGDVASNIERWKSQFEMDSKPEETSTTVGDLHLSIVEASGTYLAPGGPMMQSQGKKPNYRLHGVIVEGPQGSVFFKITGPANTISAADKDISKLIASIRKLAI